MRQTLLKILYKIYALFAKIYVRRTKPQIIGVTGSVGKTSARMIIFQVLEKYLGEKQIYTSPKNYNSEIGMVLSIFEIEEYSPSIKNLLKLVFVLFWKSLFQKKKSDILVLEYGIDTPRDMDFLLKIAKPDYGIFTKLDYIHSANFASKEGVGEEKIKLLKATKKAVFLNFQDDFQREYHLENKEKYFYNTEKIDYSYDVVDGSIVASFDLKGQKVQTNILGEENFIYIDLAFEILKDIQKDYTISSNLTPNPSPLEEKGIGEVIKQESNCFLELQNQPGRFSILEGKYESVIVDSSYNAGLESMKKMIENTCALQQQIYLEKKILFVLGDMREAGESTEKIHKELFDFASERGEIISVGKESAAYFGKHLGNFKYSAQAGIFLREYLHKAEEKYLILFKGSQNTIFLEEAIKEVLRFKKDRQKLVRQESYWKKEDF